MAVTKAYHLNSVWIDTDDRANTTIGGITRKTISTGIETIKEMSSGSLYPEVAYISGSSPSASLSTTHCENLLVALGVRAMCITSATTGSGVHLWARKLECGGTDPSDTVHQRYTFSNGIVIPTSLNCDHQGNAAIDFQIFGVETSGSDAIVVTDDQDIDSSTTVNTDRWTLHTAQVGGVAIYSKKNITIDFGNRPLLESADDDLAPTFASVQEGAPMITMRGIDPAAWWAATGGLSGVACTHANTEIWLKQRGVAVGTGAHIKFTMHGIAYTQQAFDASGHATGEVDLQIEGTEDSSGTVPLVAAVDQTIS